MGIHFFWCREAGNDTELTKRNGKPLVKQGFAVRGCARDDQKKWKTVSKTGFWRFHYFRELPETL